jgi:histidinol phosphatase-like PHP family hydrolase
MAVALDNASIAELLAREAVDAGYPLQKALRRAARAAFLWPEEAVDLARQGRSLTELPAIGPHLEKVIKRWIEQRPSLPAQPEFRRDFLTLTKARRILQRRPQWLSRLQGDLQMHTEWSDGSGSILEMAQAAEQRAYHYIAITDHSKGLKIAGGINEDELSQQGEEIARVNETLASDGRRVRVLRSVELNLNPFGEGDLNQESLAQLDIVLGSFHSALRKTHDQTERYLAALRNPTIQILGHPRGRIYNYRSGLNANWSQVFDTAAALGKAVEIDSYPDRQDLDVELLKQAKRADCYLSIGTDAHHPWQLEFIDLGLAAAALAGIKPERILNFMSRQDLMRWVAEVRRRGLR